VEDAIDRLGLRYLIGEVYRAGHRHAKNLFPACGVAIRLRHRQAAEIVIDEVLSLI
jgi:hypothetical protein